MNRAVIKNPILPGFNPDPSIVRVGDDYFIATSTFEWFPGVRLHHSRDLAHWRLVGHALTRRSQIELAGVADSTGSWAPSLSFSDGKFWLIYTNVRTGGMGRPFKDVGIHLITAERIEGPWSEPIALNSIGFDPSLFHDSNGDKWLVNMMWDFRPGRNRFAGIVVQRYDPGAEKLVGPMTHILAKAELTEGPNLYQHDGWYYLMLAEGGTSWNHGIAMARSRSVVGPYELDPQGSVLTSRDDPSLALQKAGHGELVQTAGGEWYLVHLASRPVSTPEGRRCMLGRETCLQRVTWSPDGWLRLKDGGWHPQTALPGPAGATPVEWPSPAAIDHFDDRSLAPQWQCLRGPADASWLSLEARPGWVRLRGRESLHSLFAQSLLARRLRSVRCVAETSLEFQPDHFTQMAGLICYYDTRTHFYLRIAFDEKLGKSLGVVLTDDGVYGELADSPISIESWNRCFLRAEIDRAALQFSASPDGACWSKIGPILDASKLSDDYGQGLHFTGAMVGICAQDLGGTGKHADFDYFMLRDFS